MRLSISPSPISTAIICKFIFAMEKAAKIDWYHSLTERFMHYADTGVPTDIPNCYSQAKVSVAMSLLMIKEHKKRLNRLYRMWYS